jgi:hypothetical protein
MGVCWFCHWGWAPEVARIYNNALKKLEAIGSDWMPLNFYISHIVWEDENFEDSSIDFCLKTIEEKDHECTQEVAEIVKESLLLLKKVPIEYREEPEDYDDENPENYPPPWLKEKQCPQPG